MKLAVAAWLKGLLSRFRLMKRPLPCLLLLLQVACQTMLGGPELLANLRDAAGK